MRSEQYHSISPIAGEGEPPSSVVPIGLGSLMLVPHARQENAETGGGGDGAKKNKPDKSGKPWNAGIVAAQQSKAKAEQAKPGWRRRSV